MQSCFGLGRSNGSLLRPPGPAERREGAPPSLHHFQNESPTQGLKDFPFPDSPLAPCTLRQVLLQTHILPWAGQSSPGHPVPFQHLLAARHTIRSRGAAHGVGQPAWLGMALTCHWAATTQDMLLNPSKAKERTPKLVWAGWGGNSAALILGTQSLLASQGAPSPVHPAPAQCILPRESFVCATEPSPRPDPAAPDTWKQPCPWPGTRRK